MQIPNKLVRTTSDGSFYGRKAQKFGYRNDELINPKKGLQSSDSELSSLTKMSFGLCTHLELAKRKREGSKRQISVTRHGTWLVAGSLGQATC